ncbi:MAG TPA: sigma-54 dependent transcriptional regulator [Anaerolineales bacterium]|nr:sigma-54 dependent transcriptional regulator [Anaerolineales bacterium]
MTVTILIIDDEETARKNIGDFLTARKYEVLNAGSLTEARQHLRNNTADIILLDVQLPDGYGPDLLEETINLPVRPPIILITAYGDVDMAVEAMKSGAHDFLQKPIQLTQLEKSIRRAQELVSMRQELAHLRAAQFEQIGPMICTNTMMLNLLSQAQRAATASVSVLITGETGTGKEVMANAIRRMGPRQNKPFIAINCAAIQPTMLESELFGYEAGAFTGADKRKHGLMEVADGGILFLDEISSMPTDMQAKLLRAIEEHSFRRVGGTTELKVDVQVIAASNRDLPTMVNEHNFRNDLYYRLKVVDLHLPPLRERKDEIPELVGLFIRQNNARLGMNITDVTPRALHALVNHAWPGNIRELKNVIERAMLFCDEPALDLAHLPPEVARAGK